MFTATPRKMALGRIDHAGQKIRILDRFLILITTPVKCAL